jgi:hypothetical protein
MCAEWIELACGNFRCLRHGLFVRNNLAPRTSITEDLKLQQRYFYFQYFYERLLLIKWPFKQITGKFIYFSWQHRKFLAAGKLTDDKKTEETGRSTVHKYASYKMIVLIVH